MKSQTWNLELIPSSALGINSRLLLSCIHHNSPFCVNYLSFTSNCVGWSNISFLRCCALIAHHLFCLSTKTNHPQSHWAWGVKGRGPELLRICALGFGLLRPSKAFGNPTPNNFSVYFPQPRVYHLSQRWPRRDENCEVGGEKNELDWYEMGPDFEPLNGWIRLSKWKWKCIYSYFSFVFICITLILPPVLSSPCDSAPLEFHFVCV